MLDVKKVPPPICRKGKLCMLRMPPPVEKPKLSTILDKAGLTLSGSALRKTGMGKTKNLIRV